MPVRRWARRWCGRPGSFEEKPGPGTPVSRSIKVPWPDEAGRAARRRPFCRGACLQARLRWPQPGRVPVGCSLAPTPARRAGDFADGEFPGGGSGQREAGLNLVAVAAAVFLLDHVAGLGQVGDDAAGAALGDAQGWPRCRAAACPGRGRCAAAPGRGWSGSSSSPPLRTCHYFQNFIASFQLQM